MPEGGRPNQLELETQRTNLLLQETLGNLDYTLTKMQQQQSQLDLGVKLDNVIRELASSNMSTRQAMTEYSKIAQNMYAGLQQTTVNQDTAAMQQSQIVAQQLMDINSRLTMYSPDYRPPATRETMSPEFAEAFNLHSEVNRFRYDFGYGRDAAAAGYFTDPTLTPEYMRGRDANSADREMAWYQEMKRVAEKGSAEDVRSLVEQERNMMEETQKAALNAKVSEALGLPRRLMDRAEFEAIALPGLSNFAESYGMALDQAASVISKMRQMHAVTADLHTGKGIEILSALDQANEIFQKLSGILKTTDLNEIVSYAGTLTRIGEGDFRRGLREVRHNTYEILGDMYSPATSMAEAQASAQRYGMMFGPDSMAAMNAGAWDARMQGLLARYGTGEYYTTGNLNTAASVYTQIMASRAAGAQGMLLAAGNGDDVLGGAERLINKSLDQGAVEFYLDLPKRMRASQKRVMGPMAELDIEHQLERNMADFGMTRDEALLVLAQGNADAVSAYKEVEAAKGRRARDLQDTMQSGMFAGRLSPERRSLPFIRVDSRPYTADEMDFSYDFMWNTQLRVPYLTTEAKRFMRDVKMGFDFSGSSETYNTAGLAQAETRDYNAGTSYMADDTLSSSSVASLMVRAASTATAGRAALKVIDRMANGNYKPEIKDIQNILIQGTNDLVNEGITMGMEDQMKAYIAGLTAEQALTEIFPSLDYESPVAKVIQMVANESGLSTAHLTDEQIMRQQLMGSLTVAGIDPNRFRGGSQALRDTAQWMKEHENEMEAAGIALGTAMMFAPIPGGRIGAAAVFAADLAISTIGMPTLIEGVDRGINYLETMAGSAIDFEAVSQTLGLADTSVTALGSEIRHLILWLRMLVASFGMDFSRETKLGRLQDLLQQVLQTYSNLIHKADREDPGRRQRKDGKSEPLSDAMCNSLINFLSRGAYDSLSRSGKLHSSMTYETVRKIYATIVYTINDERSNVGSFLRTKGNNPSRLDKDIMQEIQAISDDVAEWTWEGSTMSSMRTVLEQSQDRELSQFIIQTSAMKDRTLNVGRVMEEIKLAISSNMDTTPQAKASAHQAIGKLTDAAGKGSADVYLTDEEIAAISDTFGDTKGARLKSIMAMSDPAAKQTNLFNWIQDLAGQAKDQVQDVEYDSQKLVRTFIQVANQIMGDPAAKDLSRQLYKHITS